MMMPPPDVVGKPPPNKPNSSGAPAFMMPAPDVVGRVPLTSIIPPKSVVVENYKEENDDEEINVEELLDQKLEQKRRTNGKDTPNNEDSSQREDNESQSNENTVVEQLRNEKVISSEQTNSIEDEEWLEFPSPSGLPYYHNYKRNESSWIRPPSSNKRVCNFNSY
jgi:hypothetical protein